MLKFVIIFAAVAVLYVQAADVYYLYTEAQDTPEILEFPDDISATTIFNETHKTLILIHGQGGSVRAAFNTRIREEFFKSDLHEPHNVIVLDWSEDAQHSYSVVSHSVPNVGRRLRQFIEWLNTQVTGYKISDIHLVGFGLGAHVAGIAAREIPATTGVVGRITGLDPSGSGWGSSSQRLRSTDASYVEVIHTDGSGLLANGIGTPIGDIDFYANGGSNQPGCWVHSCSHDRAWELFASTMASNRLQGTPCSSQTQLNLNTCRGQQLVMGGTAFSKTGSQLYRINTGRSWPF